jgi:hypothetical protein
LTRFLSPDVPVFCPSMGFVGTVRMLKPMSAAAASCDHDSESHFIIFLFFFLNKYGRHTAATAEAHSIAGLRLIFINPLPRPSFSDASFAAVFRLFDVK